MTPHYEPGAVHIPRPDCLAELGSLIADAQKGDPFRRVTVMVPTPYARVQVRRLLGARMGLCNVSFRTHSELVGELARASSASQFPLASLPAVRETVRLVLDSDRSLLESLPRSPSAVSHLAKAVEEHWREGTPITEGSSGSDRDAHTTSRLISAVEGLLAKRGYLDRGRYLEEAASATLNPQVLGTVISWYPRHLGARGQKVLEAIERSAGVIRSVHAPQVLDEGRLIRCSDGDSEVGTVLRLLLASGDQGVPIWSQAILHPPGPHYGRIVRQRLEEAGVNWSGPALTTLRQSVAGRTLVDLIDVAADGWPRRALMRWLESAPITNGPAGERAPVDGWDEISARAGVVSGLDQWRDRLERFAQVGDGDDPYVAHTDVEAGAARNLLGFVLALARSANPTNCKSWSDWSAWALNLLNSYLLPKDGMEPAAQAQDWPQAEVSAAAEVRELLDDLSGLDAVSLSMPIDLATFRAALGAELDDRRAGRDRDAEEKEWAGEDSVQAGSVVYGSRQTAQNGSRPMGTGVFVGSISDARGLVFDRVYLVGLADALLPGVIEPDGGGEPAGASRSDDLRDDFMSALASGLSPAVITWPRIDLRTGREQTSSRWLSDISVSEEYVASFSAGLASGPLGSSPSSGADRRLVELHHWKLQGGDLFSHPLTAEPTPEGAGTDMEHVAAAGPPGTLADSAGGTAQAIPLGACLESGVARLATDFTRFDGNVGESAISSDSEREVSPTRLETYATCPRRYLMARHLRLKAPQRPEETEQMGARDRGTLIHEVLEAYVSERLSKGTPPSCDRLIEIAEDRFRVAESEGRCGAPLVASVERMILKRELYRFFQEDTLEPVAVELRFGGASESQEGEAPGVPPVTIPLAGGRRVSFKGSVDRVDLTADRTVVVSDYKTGYQKGLESLAQDPVDRGTRLQLPIYALAAQSYLGVSEPVVARYWLTSLGRAAGSYSCVVDDAVTKRASQVVETIMNGIEAGVFPAVPGELQRRPGNSFFDNCSHCDFDRMCPSDRGHRWSVLRHSEECEPVVALAEDPLDPSLENLVRKVPVQITERAR